MLLGVGMTRLFVALALLILTVHPPIDPQLAQGSVLVRIFVAEALVGAALGFFFGLFLWAFEAAGEIIDTAVGTSMAMIHDPISDNEVTLFGEFLSRWANYLFMVSGGLLMVTGVLLESFSIWPIGQPLPEIRFESVQLFEREFNEVFTLALMLAAPFIVIIFLVDLAMGLVNRFAQQLNVLFLSISVKSVLSIVILAMLLPSLTHLFLAQLNAHNDEVMEILRQIFIQ